MPRRLCSVSKNGEFLLVPSRALFFKYLLCITFKRDLGILEKDALGDGLRKSDLLLLDSPQLVFPSMPCSWITTELSVSQGGLVNKNEEHVLQIELGKPPGQPILSSLFVSS